jgi:phage terminase Nu1 subunit (DNA packaging protein)
MSVAFRGSTEWPVREKRGGNRLKERDSRNSTDWLGEADEEATKEEGTEVYQNKYGGEVGELQ